MKCVIKAVLFTAVAVLLVTAVSVQPASAVIADQSENFNDGNFADDTALFAAGYNFSGGGGLDTDQWTGLGGTPIGDPDSLDGVNDGGIFVEGDFYGDSVTYAFPGHDRERSCLPVWRQPL